jgi:hypothetical protein
LITASSGSMVPFANGTGGQHKKAPHERSLGGGASLRPREESDVERI